MTTIPRPKNGKAAEFMLELAASDLETVTRFLDSAATVDGDDLTASDITTIHRIASGLHNAAIAINSR